VARKRRRPVRAGHGAALGRPDSQHSTGGSKAALLYESHSRLLVYTGTRTHTRTTEGAGPTQFDTVHGIRISNDNLVYVADRVDNRIQVFALEGKFVKEAYIERKTTSTEGTAFGIAFSPDKQQFLYVPDGSDKKA